MQFIPLLVKNSYNSYAKKNTLVEQKPSRKEMVKIHGNKRQRHSHQYKRDFSFTLPPVGFSQTTEDFTFARAGFKLHFSRLHTTSKDKTKRAFENRCDVRNRKHLSIVSK